MSEARFNHTRLLKSGEPICNVYEPLNYFVVQDARPDLPSCMVCHERLVGHNELEGIRERWDRQWGSGGWSGVIYLPPDVSPEYVSNKVAAVAAVCGFIMGLVVMFIVMCLLVVNQ